MQTLISQAAEDLIIAEEVSDRKTYDARYQRPEKPGGNSGITIGIGYDVGAGTKDFAQLKADWGGTISDAMILALKPCIGVTGERAQAMLAGVRSKVTVTWDQAIHVFETVDIPRWYKICAGMLDDFEALPPDCKGALVSLAYNRGASFKTIGNRYQEMRAIRRALGSKVYSEIPALFRAMKRLWTTQSVRGVALRREHEARLFEQGLATWPTK